MTRPTTLAAGSLALGLALAGCGGSTSSPKQAAPPAVTTAPSTGAPAAAGTSLTIKGFAFSPKSLTVKVGTTVTATNLDSAAHTWTAGSTFDSGNLAQSKSFSYTFKTAGSFSYVCTYHPRMVGTVVVTP